MADATSATARMPVPAATVLAVVADLEAYPRWARGVVSVQVLDASADGRPQRARFEVSSGPVKGTYTLDYTFTSGPGEERMAWTLVESPLLKQMDGEYVLRDGDGDGDGCTVEYRLSMTPTMPLIGPLRRTAERQLVTTAIDDLRLEVAP